jgi:hypothetical protein
MTKGRTDEAGGTYRLAVRFGIEIMEDGFTSVPNLVLNHYAALGITGAEMLFIIHVWQFWWSQRENPHPPTRALAERMGVDQRTIRNYTASLEAKGFLTTHERIVPGEGQRANVYDFAKLLKAITKAAKAGGKGAGGALGPRKDLSASPRKKISEGRRKNVSAQRLKKISGDGRKEISGQQYVVEENTPDEDPSNLRLPPIQQEQGRGQPGVAPKVVSSPTDHLVPSDSCASSDTPPDDKCEYSLADRRDDICAASEAHAQVANDAPPPADEARERLLRFAEDLARELHDAAPLRATVSRLVNTYQRSGLSYDEFQNHMYSARAITQERSAAIRTPAAGTRVGGGRKNKMAYFFAVLENRAGMRESPHRPVSEDDAAAENGSLAKTAVAQREDRQELVPRDPRSLPGSAPPTSLRDGGSSRVDAGSSPDPDASVIQSVVARFSRQFADHAAAEALGAWAVGLWQRVGLSRQRFLEAAHEASTAMLREQAASPLVFQAHLTEVLARLEDAKGGSETQR